MRILVTRHQSGAERTAARLRELGHDPVLLPLSRIVPMRPNPIPATLGFLGVVITSENAINCMPVALHRRLSELPCHVVGEHTARQAADAGFDVRTVAADTHELAARLAEIHEPGERLAYACGRVRMPALQADLKARDIELFAIEVYDTIQFSYTPDFISETLSGNPIDGVLAYSVVAARQVRDLFDTSDARKKLAKAGIYCLSDRVAAEFTNLNGPKIFVAAEPNERSLLSLLER